MSPIRDTSSLLPAALRGSGTSVAISLAERQSWPAPALTFDALDDAVFRRVEALRQQGLGPGQAVACAADVGLEFCVMQHALLRCGAALLPLASGLGGNARDLLLRSVSVEWLWSAARQALIATGFAPPGSATADGLAVLIRTSGSTGTPRVVMLSADNLLASSQAVNARFGLAHGDEWLCCLPLHGIGGLAIGYRCVLAGAAMRLHPRFDATALAADFSARQITHVSLVPPMLARLLDHGIRPPTSLRVALVGGQALHPQLARRALEAGWPLYLSYGMSETCSLVISAKPGPDDESMELGPPLPGVTLDCGRCGAEPRRLRIRGPMVMRGYGNPGRSPGLGLTDGWLMTGDVACLSRSGRLRLLGRADELVVIGGVQVNPLAVESRLAALTGIDELAVVAIEHPVWGATLAVCYSGAIERGALSDWCRANFSGSERPRVCISYQGLPRLPGGKTDRRRLAADAAAAALEAQPGSR